MVRMYVDSVWDNNIAVLISTDDKNEHYVKFTKEAFTELVKNRRGFM